MSKGLGRKQRLILDELGKRPYFYLIDLVSANPTEAEYQALYRAFQGLWQRGLVGCVRYISGKYGKVLVIRPDIPDPEHRPRMPIMPKRIHRVSVEQCTTSCIIKHLEG